MYQFNFELAGKSFTVTANPAEFNTSDYGDVYFDIVLNGEETVPMLAQKNDSNDWVFDYPGNHCFDELTDAILDYTTLDEIGTTRNEHVICFCDGLIETMTMWVEKYVGN